ncbi:MAG: hypothetical protein ACOVQT_07985, partial [Rubrivivax sp.]
NPDGVLFGHGARVDVASLVAGSMRMLDSDFLAGRYRLSAPEALAGSVVNQGLLTSRFGGQILLVGGSEVRNEGSINAPGGHAGLVAGRSVELVDTGLPNLAVKVTVPDHKAEVTNLGRLATPGGRIDIYAGIVNQQGLLEAQSLSVGERGEIVLQASDTLMLQAGSRTDASGQGKAQGGRIDLSAPQIGLVGDAQVDASGATGGGIRIGGGLRGQEADITHARALFMGEQARVNADGRDGDGGRIVLWSDQVTRGHGHLSARGGLLGQGGFIEVSSKGVLDWGGSADLRVADLNPARACVHLPRPWPGGVKPDHDPADERPLDARTLRAVSVPPAGTLARLRELPEGAPLILWMDVPHVLYRGSVPLGALGELRA